MGNNFGHRAEGVEAPPKDCAVLRTASPKSSECLHFVGALAQFVSMPAHFGGVPTPNCFAHAPNVCVRLHFVGVRLHKVRGATHIC